MKLNKNFVQITVTALVSSAASFLFITKVKPEMAAAPVPPSQTITWNDAKDFMKQYVDFKPLFVQYTQSNGVPFIDSLEGFVFESAHLNEIINDNHSPSGNPDQVVFFFGQEGKFNDGSGLFDHKRGNIRMIAVGARNNMLLIDARDGLQPSIYDKADPCPPMCPR